MAKITLRIPKTGLIFLNHEMYDGTPNGNGAYLPEDNKPQIHFVVYKQIDKSTGNDCLKFIINHTIDGVPGEIQGSGFVKMVSKNNNAPSGYGNIVLSDIQGNTIGEEKIIVHEKVDKNNVKYYRIVQDSQVEHDSLEALMGKRGYSGC